ncbi:pentatricopeptide repeat-containing protein 1, mitochondrial-like [Liolophura sinensis]|uniref:pentatricopeptide repeat-containing protein 1, mitochondrial-like n=1 Tax=Liolophura sinensis TaxID=3198878 RepID=UPI00315860D4
MSSVYRFLGSALRQLSELSLVTQGICLNRRCALPFCSHLSSQAGDEESGETASFDRKAPVRNKANGHGQKSVKDNWRRYKIVKLHKRTLNAEEREQDYLLKEQMSQLPRDELFGTMKRKETDSDQREKYNQMNLFSADNESKPDFGKTSSKTMFDRSSVECRSKGNSNKRFDQQDKQSDDVTKTGKSKQWTENFGTLRSEHVDRWMDGSEDLTKRSDDDDQKDYYSSDDEDDKPFRRLSSQGKHSAEWYGRQMRHFADEGKIKEAIDVLDVWMLKNDRVKPNYYVFSILISILGKAGYTKKAFKVFNQMKKMGVKPKPNTYTALFNACSNSPWPQDGLQRAQNLENLMKEKRHQPNIITYRAMIKAYGVCGDVQAAFRVLDEASVHCQPDLKCFSFLLMACCSDREAGFRHAILVWRLMHQYHLLPTLYQYNLLLRVIRDCGIGDLNMAAPLIFGREVAEGQSSGNSQTTLRIENGESDNTDTSHICQDDFMSVSPDMSKDITNERMVIDFNAVKNGGSDGFVELNTGSMESQLAELSSLPDHPSVLESPLEPNSLISVDLTLLKSAQGRLALSGGMLGILSNMAADGVTPDIKTLSQLVSAIPSNVQAEKELIHVLESQNIQPDVDFFNMLIRKRNLRKDYDRARDLLRVIGEYKLLPNMMTFGCLAMGCRKRVDGLQLLKDIESCGLSPNREIFTILIYNSAHEFYYKLDLLRELEKRDMEPSEKMLSYIELQVQTAKKSIVQQESGQQVNEYYASNYFLDGYKAFMKFYGPWLKRTPMAQKEHPWAKFRHPKDPPKGQSEDHEEDNNDFVWNT